MKKCTIPPRRRAACPRRTTGTADSAAAATIAAAAAVAGCAILLSAQFVAPPRVSAWTTTTSSRPRGRVHPAAPASRRRWRSWLPHRPRDNGALIGGRSLMLLAIQDDDDIEELFALPDDDDGASGNGGENGSDNENVAGDGSERRRKRDIFRRTLGLGGEQPPQQQEPVKLNTDGLFKGMPGMDSILGGSSSDSPLLDVMPDSMSGGGYSDASSASSAGGTQNFNLDDDDEPSFQKAGQIQPEPDLLTPQDIADLDAKYDAIQSQSEQLVSSKLSELLATGDAERTAKGLEELNITMDEARKIVDYAIAEEKATEKRQWDLQRKDELVRQWEALSREREDGLRAEDGEQLLEDDGVAREILQNAQEREQREDEREEGKRQLDFYERQLTQRKEVEGTVEKAAESFAAGGDVDIDDVYEEALDNIQSSRSNKLGPKSLGVWANSMALEEGREFLRNQRAQKDFLKEVEQEAGMVGASDAEVAQYFRAPTSYEEERMYRSIVRRIVEKREEVVPTLDAMMGGGATEGMVGSEDVEGEEGYAPPPSQDVKAKYKLSAKETVEAYKLLNLWREMQREQVSLEEALGMRDESANVGGMAGGGSARPLNKLEPFFLYEEDTEEKRQKEKDRLAKVLQKSLASEDDIEKSSNDLLMKELLEGGITKDRAVRLLDKLLSRAEDATIKESLMEMKKVIMEEDSSGTEMQQPQDQPLFMKKKSGGPVDLSGVFRTSDMNEEGEETFSLSPSSAEPSGGGTSGRTMPSWVDDEKKETPMPPPPNTPFFSSSTEEEETIVAKEDTTAAAAPPPPNTPFFQSTEYEEDDLDAEEGSEKSPTGGMFGTYEEQRLQKLASRVGVQSEEDMEEFRRNMEALKEAEEMASLQLNDDDFDIAAASAKLGIDVSSLNLDDESDDQIMSVIGKRPVAAETTSSEQKKAILELNEEETDDIIVDAEGHLKKMTTKQEKDRDIADDIFRAKTAGRRYSDREARDADEAAYKDFLQMEQQAEKQFDSIDETSASRQDIDIDAYAEDIMSEIKPRPRIRGRREDVMSQEDILKERKQESIFGDDDPFPVMDSGGPSPTSSASSSGDGGVMPEWFRKEQEARGVKVEDLDEDEFAEARREWEREERQRKADEYLQKRGEGISISDVLGREYFGPMDEPDDNYEMTRSSFDSFEARKELLLGYTELTVEDINNVVDYKVDPLATGYNRYLSRVQNPFGEYGAIFRLEGVFVDMIGMHAKAWKHVAETYGYQIQSGEEVQRASLYKPEEAVREVFYWTDDIFLIKDIAETHHAAFNEAFDEWLESGKVVTTSNGEEDIPTSNGLLETPKAMPSEEEMNSLYYLCWSKLAQKLDKPAPTNDQVYRGVLGGDWEVAVSNIFPPEWNSEDPNEVYDVVVAYDEIFQADYRILLQKYGIDLDKINAEEAENQYGMQFAALSIKEGVKEWLDTLRDVEMPCAVMSHLDSDQLDAVLSVTGLSEYFPDDKRVSSDSGYSSERSELLGAALRVEQRPDKCVIFDNTPHSANEAHEVFMKSISFVDHYARYELLTADLSVAYARDLDLISFVKLFDERTDLEPVLELDVNSGLQKQQRKAKTAFWDD
eukprot:CAMPEP_0183716264 /NCGR_PEP_ID=MMETSP0737-20130205/10241_1 /TAXON_ID=385413 /ORGANISM="Thalassiosira miniscula, Strain CCMP1093" /LENGTH=1592 /DNA_ID=CAMNT_0025945507 /DNA_START=165 /DNA_END=4943 /DNA_ORIENTATION=-